MQSLLSSRDRRQLALLELLMENRSVTLNRISEEIRYPRRTLSEDIRRMNDFLPPARIDTGADGISLYIPADSSIRSIYTLLLRQSREYQLMAHLFFHESQSQEDIAEALFVSVSTLRRMIGSMNPILEQQGFRIQTAPFQVVGDEDNITQFYVALFTESYREGQGLISPAQRQVLVALCTRAVQNGQMHMNYPDVRKLMMWVFVRTIRTINGHHTILTQEVPSVLYEGIADDQTMQEQFYAAFQLELNKTLAAELFQRYLRFGFAWRYDDMEIYATQSLASRQRLAQIQTLMQNAAEALSISTDGTKELQRTLFNILQFREKPHYILYSRYKIFIKSFGQYYAPILAILQDVVRRIFSKTYVEDAMDEILYLLVTHWPGIVQRIEETVPRIAVSVFFDSDIEHAQLIADMIKQGAKINMHVFVPELAGSESTDLLCEGADLLVTNIPELECTCKKIICVQEYPSADDWQNILLTVEEIFNQRMLENLDF